MAGKRQDQETKAPETEAPETEARETKAKQGAAAKPGRDCPICGKPASPEFRPFCSARCADVDLHRWLSGGYVIPGKDALEGDGENGGEND